MPYADPSRSPYSAARHLLRHLKDARALRRNPIVIARVPEESSNAAIIHAARALVDSAFSRMEAATEISLRRRARHTAILLRCDVLAESRPSVACDLGLSLPQFERERRAAMARFVTCCEYSGSRERAIDWVRPVVASTVRNHAVRLSDSGDRHSARRLLDEVVRSAPALEKARALICISEIETAEHAAESSRAALDSAAAILRGDASGETSHVWLAHQAATLRLRVVEKGPQTVARSLRFSPDLPACAESAALLVAQAEVLDGCGMIRSSRPYVSTAVDLLAQTREPDPALSIDLAFLECQMSFWLDPAAKGRHGLDDAMRTAQEAGYAGRAMFAELSLWGGKWAGGDPAARRQYRRLAARIAASTEMSRQTKFFAYWDAADVECGVGDPWRAAEAARNALSIAPNAGRGLLMKSLLARAYARGGRLDVARQIASQVVEDADTASNGMALLSARRTLAYVAAKLGTPVDAWEHLRDAAGLARRYGTARVAAELEERVHTNQARRRAPSVSIVF